MCLGCLNTSNKFEDFISLPLTFPPEFYDYKMKGLAGAPVSLGKCLNNYFTKETLRGSNQYFCSKCKKKNDATIRLTMDSCPEILMINLKRFNKMQRKINNMVKFPVQLNLD